MPKSSARRLRGRFPCAIVGGDVQELGGLEVRSAAAKRVRFDAKFLLYLAGTGAWLSFTTFSGSSYSAAFSGDDFLARIVQTACFSLSFFVICWLDCRKGPFRRYALVIAVTASFVLAFAAHAVCRAFGLPAGVLYVPAAFLAFGSACGYCQWLRILADQEFRRAQWLLALGSMVLIAVMFGYELLSDPLRDVVTFGALAPLSVALLAANVRVHSFGGGTPSRHVSAHQLRLAAKDVSLPIVCAMALVLITPIASVAFGSPEGDDGFGGLLLPIAHAASLALLMAVWFGLKKSVTLPRFYCVFLPIFASLAFLLPLLDPSQTWIILFVGNACFFFVSVLMVTTCLELAQRSGVSAVSLYGLFAGCVYLSNVVQLGLEHLSRAGVLHFESYAAALVLLYVLVIPAFFIVTVGRSKRLRVRSDKRVAGAESGEERVEGPGGVLSDTERACALVAEEHALSARQAEVLALLALGRDVTHIANTLYLSPNTVRSYRKTLYAALGVHGKQELIDMVEERRKALLSSAG